MPRPNQKSRTRKDLLQAAAALTRRGLIPTLEEVAEEAMVSRATAYRYFPGVEALLAEAAVDVVTPGPDEFFAGETSVDPVRRVDRVDAMLHDIVLANETQLRLMLMHSMERVVRGEAGEGAPVRQNRRTPLIEAALEPAREDFDPKALKLLIKALGLVIGTESMVASKDVLQLDDADARKVKAWMIKALVEAARK
jgi:AcrR family transcriptional regulator